MDNALVGRHCKYDASEYKIVALGYELEQLDYSKEINPTTAVILSADGKGRVRYVPLLEVAFI